MARSLRALGSSLAVLVLMALPVFAQEGGGEAKESNILLWQWLNFLILAGLLGWLIVKQGGPALKARTKQIQEGLAAGEKSKREADARAAIVQKQIANLGVEIDSLRAGAREERDREAERIRLEGQAEIARIRQQAEQEIEAAGKQARLDVQGFAARLAIELAEQKLRASMSSDAQAALLTRFVSSLGRIEPSGAKQ